MSTWAMQRGHSLNEGIRVSFLGCPDGDAVLLWDEAVAQSL
jgi:hypothetical protein